MFDPNLQSPFYSGGGPFDTGAGAPPASRGPSWLPPGAVQNPDGSISLPNGTVNPAPGPGMQRDPNTGILTPIPGYTGTPPSAADYQPGGKYGPQFGPGVGSNIAPPKPPPKGGPGPTDTGSGPTTLNSLIAPYDKTFTAPPQLNLGGAPGLSYIPPAPTLSLPNQPTTPLTLPTYTRPPAFSYQDFSLPTGAQVLANDPGFGFREQLGLDAITNNAAAQGTVRGGSTLKNLVEFGQNYASGEYGNAVDRAFGTYQTNRANAADAYRTNYQTQFVDPYTFDVQQAKGLYGANVIDPYTRATSAAVASFAPQEQNWQTLAAAGQRQNELNFTQGLDAFNTNFDVAKFNKQWPYTVLSDQARMGLDAASR